MGQKFLHSIVPSDLRKLPRATLPNALERMLYAVGIVGDLQPSLAPRTEFSVVYGMFWIAFQFLGQSHFDNAQLAVPDNLGLAFHDPGLNATARGAQSANARLPNGDARNQVLFRNETNELRSS